MRQRQLFAAQRMSAAHRKALIHAALLDYPLRQAARAKRRRDAREGLPTWRPTPEPRLQYHLPFTKPRRAGWLTMPE